MRAELRIRLHLHAIHAAVAIEIVDIERAERALQRDVDVIEAHAQQFRFLDVYRDIDARHLRRVRRGDVETAIFVLELGALRRRGNQRLRHLLERRVVVRARLHEAFQAADVRHAFDGGRRQREDEGVPDRRPGSHQSARHGVRRELGLVALRPVLEQHEAHAGVAALAARLHVEARDRDVVEERRMRERGLIELIERRLRALHRRCRRQHGEREHVALVLVRRERARHRALEPHDRRDHQKHRGDRDVRVPHRPAHARTCRRA